MAVSPPFPIDTSRRPFPLLPLLPLLLSSYLFASASGFALVQSSNRSSAQIFSPAFSRRQKICPSHITAMSSSTASPPSLTTPKNQSSGGGDDDDDAPSSPFRSSPVVLVGFSHGDGRLQKLASAYSERTSGSVVISPDSGGIRDISVIDLDADPSREIPIYSTSPDGSRPLLVYASSAEDDEAFLVRLSGVTSHEVAISGDMVWEDMAWLLDRLSTHARNPGVAVGGEGARRTMGPHTFFLSLSFGDVNEAAEYMGAMCGDTDVMEFRMDLIKNQVRHM
uniref:Uncharacterized protein n=1 Tax=Corethron hystrix TaxID=216773 RepID=A0A7S1BU71_9STRA